MAMARMPEDRSKTVNKQQHTLSNTFKAIYTCMCTPVGPTDSIVWFNTSYYIISCAGAGAAAQAMAREP
eukprot:15758896-Heterocapsa_arctica.AAC.1